MTESTANAQTPLQFDSALAAGAAPTTSCTSCSEPIRTVYYEANGSVVCSRCRGKLESQVAVKGGARRFRRAFAFGVGAAVAGAILYYAFIAITGYNVGIVAILVGWMVGKAVFNGSDQRGGRRYQVLAVVLTYFAIASTYVPLAYKELKDEKTAATADSSKVSASAEPSESADSVAAAATVVTTPKVSKAKSASGKGGVVAMIVGLGALLLLVAMLPVLAGFSSIISVFIIIFGLSRAWRMNRAVVISVTGPFRIAGSNPESALAT